MPSISCSDSGRPRSCSTSRSVGRLTPATSQQETPSQQSQHPSRVRHPTRPDVCRQGRVVALQPAQDRQGDAWLWFRVGTPSGLHMPGFPPGTARSPEAGWALLELSESVHPGEIHAIAH